MKKMEAETLCRFLPLFSLSKEADVKIVKNSRVFVYLFVCLFVCFEGHSTQCLRSGYRYEN